MTAPRDPVRAGGLACLALLAAMLAPGMAGCASTSVSCADLSHGQCTVTSRRLLTDSSVALADPGTGLSLQFSSKPNEAGTAAAFATLNATIGVLVKLIPAAAVAAPASPQAAAIGPPLQARE